ncbi:hypothetical protein HQ531_09285 [bacterium]|nr:hypothetical protein [bacterium]
MNEQIEMIDRVLGELQKNVAAKAAKIFLLGWGIVLGCITHLLLGYFDKYEWLMVNWIVISFLSMILGILMFGRDTSRSKSSKHEILLLNLWGVAGLVQLYIGFVAPYAGFIESENALPMVLLIMFISVMVTGLAVDHRPTIGLSIFWVIGSITASLLPDQFQVLVLLVVVLCGFLLPSYLIKVKFN